MRNLWIAAALVPTVLASTAHAGEPSDPDTLTSDPFTEARQEYHPYVHYPQVKTIDVRQARDSGEFIAEPTVQPDFHGLDEHKLPDAQLEASPPSQRAAGDDASLPQGWVQKGSVVMPSPIVDGFEDVGTGPIFAVEDIPGNKYPRKHTLFLNFGGGMLYTGADNSAENRSTLAKQGVYPTFGGGESVALSIIQAVEADFAPFGIRIMYESRPNKTVPYTMEMVGGSWTDTTIDSAAGGVAPGADCGALGQRHVVYTFSNGGSVLGAASTIAQEAGHAYGLDHTFDCTSVMSYCGGGDKAFRSGCEDLCEAQCQGANSAGCRLTHEMFCGEGADQQDDVAEMAWIFGGNEPDMEPPTVDIQSPIDGEELEEGDSVQLRAVVDDNYGGFGWKFTVEKDGEVIFDQPDYERDVDAEFRAALNLSNLETGVWTFTVEAEDQYEHITSQTVTVTVGGAVAPETTGPAGDGSSGGVDETDGDMTGPTSGTGGGSDGSGGPVSGSSSAGAEGGDGGGNSCSMGGRGTPAPLMLLGAVGLLGFARRRRSSKTRGPRA